MRLLLRVADRLRRLIPAELPLFVRISATDWVDGGWDIEQSVVLAGRLKALGVDLIDVSSGAMVPKAAIAANGWPLTAKLAATKRRWPGPKHRPKHMSTPFRRCSLCPRRC
jgi:2,4-dienoyl-CoA reductase-like NADH-dependent reductase (Old Yellow Enzyme family)